MERNPGNYGLEGVCSKAITIVSQKIPFRHRFAEQLPHLSLGLAAVTAIQDLVLP